MSNMTIIAEMAEVYKIAKKLNLYVDMRLNNQVLSADLFRPFDQGKVLAWLADIQNAAQVIQRALGEDD